jgi:hypothetical protein
VLLEALQGRANRKLLGPEFGAKLLPQQWRRDQRTRPRPQAIQGSERLRTPVLQEIEVDFTPAFSRASLKTRYRGRPAMHFATDALGEVSHFVVIVTGPCWNTDVKPCRSRGFT